MTPERRLAALGRVLPRPWEPGARLIMATRHHDLMFLAGHMGIDMRRTVNFHGRTDHHPIVAGRVGAEVSLDDAFEVARGGALNLLATLKHELGKLSRVRRILKVTALVNTVDNFVNTHQVADAASDLLVEVFGPRGEHVRSTVGTTSQPGNSCFAIDAICVVE